MDSYTQSLLERTQERQRKLNENLQSSKRGRQPFSEKQIADDDNGEQEESPKRLCREESSIEEKQKENAVHSSPPQTPLRGLAALRRHDFSNDLQPSISSVRRQELQETVTKTESSCPKRLNTKLAALASQINEWNNKSSPSPAASSNTNVPSNSISVAAKEIAKKRLSSGSESPSVNFKSQSSNVPVQTCSGTSIPKPPPLPVDSPVKVLPNRELASPLSSSIVKSPAKPPRGVQTPLKKAVWDHAVVATLESQGFMKTPSASKLSYDYNKISVKNRVEDYEVATGLTSAEEKVDPAELPVSAKKAMFEKKPELLTVAQRAALFNKGGSSTPKFPKTPLTPSVPIREPSGQNSSEKKEPVALARILSGSKQECAEKRPSTLARTPSGSGTGRDFCGVPLHREDSKSNNAFTPKRVSASPIKNVGDHTRQVQKMLFEQPQASTSAEIALKEKLERQKEMEALRDRWNRESPSKEICTDHATEYAPQSDEESSDDFEESVATVDESYSCEAASICRRMDEMLDEAVDEEISVSEITGTQSDSSYSQMDSLYPQVGTSSQSSSPSPSTESDIAPRYDIATSYKFLTPNPRDDVRREIDNQTKREEEPLELIHTISFYRRQKQECATPPMRCIVRREEVLSPPSPVGESLNVASQLKMFQEELYKQDVSLRQASQVVALCSSTPEFHSSPQHVEGEKLLLVATLRRHAFKQEIERLKTEAVLGSRSGENIGILTVSEIRLPLKREFLAALLENRHLSESAVHHFFCILKYREKVISTEMLSTSDGITAGTLCFTNHICLQGLGGNFSVSFEVYALQTIQCNQEKKGHNKKDHSKKLKKTEAKTLLSPSCSAPIAGDAIRTSNFGLVGRASFTLENCRHRCFSLEKVPKMSPIEGRLDARLELHANVNIEERGFLTMFEDVSGFGAWHRRWFVLSRSKLSFWKYPDEEFKKDPMGSINLKQCVSQEICLVPRDVCARPNTFQLLYVRPQSKNDQNTLVTQSHNSFTTVKYLLSADTKEERIIWCRRLTEALTTLRLWNTDALRPIEMPQ